ncbi:MAG: PDZ domain-containing protein, partial [candidate division NC10 bacterium]|nr:PDZ domain-containing protein [candidate division NC10 bacterium]
RSNVGITAYEDFIQTDASITPGTSGGPLLNVRGEVIGINTAIVAAGQGIGFAIPINMAKGIKDMLIAQGRVVRGWLGVQIQSLTEDLATQFGAKQDEGVLIANVLKDGPAEKGGLKEGDVILEVDGAKVTGVSQLQRLVAAVPPGKQVNLRVRREGRDLFLTLAVGEMPTEEPVAAAAPEEQGAAPYGFKVQDLTPELREQFGLKETDGVVVSELDPEGPAARTGLRPEQQGVRGGGAPREGEGAPPQGVAGRGEPVRGGPPGQGLVPGQVMRPHPDRRFCRGSCRRRASLAAGPRHPLSPFRHSLNGERRPRGSHAARPLGGRARRHPRLGGNPRRNSLARHCSASVSNRCDSLDRG